MKDATNYNRNNDVMYHDDDFLAKYILKRAFLPPLASALSKGDMSSLHNELRYLRSKVMEEVRQGKSRRSGKQEVEEKFVPSISVGEWIWGSSRGTIWNILFPLLGALANLQGFFETLGQNLESLEEKKLPVDQQKFLERDRGLDHHVRKGASLTFNTLLIKITLIFFSFRTFRRSRDFLPHETIRKRRFSARHSQLSSRTQDQVVGGSPSRRLLSNKLSRPILLSRRLRKIMYMSTP